MSQQSWSGLQAAVLAAAAAIQLGCGDGPKASGHAVARIDGEALDASVVRHIASRDGIESAEAKQRAIETLRLAAAARAEHAAGHSDPGPLLAPAREAQLLRGARARLWLDEGFVPSRGAEAIGTEDPLMARALASSRFVHPEVHRVCQVVVVPKSASTLDEALAITTDPQWRERAHRVLDPVAVRMRRYVPEGDAEACALIGRSLKVLKPSEVDEDLVLRFEKQTAFHLAACASENPDGSCAQPSFDAAWTAQIAKLSPGHYAEVFAGSWGLHLAYLVAIEPARPKEDPATLAWIREEIHPQWIAHQFVTTVERLQQKRAVRIAMPTAPEVDDADAP
ncbi:MAG: peptidylprolyl isomerase [Myxococcota bacterium]